MEVLQAQGLERGGKTMGSGHPDTILTMGRLARAWSAQGRYQVGGGDGF